MRMFALAAVAALSVHGSAMAQAPAAADDAALDTPCFFVSAQRVPAIPGLTITGGKVTPGPSQGALRTRLVAITVTLADRAATYNFLCGAQAGRFTAEFASISE